MTSRDLKKENRYRRERTRPEGAPAEILALKNGTVAPAYGVRKTGHKWQYLTNPITLEWIDADKVNSVKKWTISEQQKLDKTQPIEQKTPIVKKQLPTALKLDLRERTAQKVAGDKMIFSIQYKDKSERIMTDFNGVIIGIKQKDKDNKSITDYLKVLTNKYGSNNISYTYVLQ